MEKDNQTKNVYIVLTKTETIAAKSIRFRAGVADFFLRDGKDRVHTLGYKYSHASLSRDKSLSGKQMMSFSREDVNRVFSPCLQYEDIHDGMFAHYKDKTEIVVAEVNVSNYQYQSISDRMDSDYERRDEFSFNYFGLFAHLLKGKGASLDKDKFFCSQWVADVLRSSGVELFEGKETYDTKPNDFYVRLKNNIIYEGPLAEYPPYKANNQEELMSSKKYVYTENRRLAK